MLQPIITPTPTPTSAIIAPTLPRTIYLGVRGDDVAQLQNYLISLGYLAGGNTSGYFGYLTRDAVQRYQCAKLSICSGSEGNNGYGVVGMKTRQSISGGIIQTTSTSSTATLTGEAGPNLNINLFRGSKGNEVTQLQNYLIKKGYLSRGFNTGLFGNLTRDAVQKYQCAKLSICSGSEGGNGYGLVGSRTRELIRQGR